MPLSSEQIRFLDAAEQGDTPTVRALLAAGVDVNTPDDRRLPRNRTALMHASQNGHLDVVDVLLAAGADLDIKDRGLGAALPGGNTALLLALKHKQTRVAQRLLESGADPRVSSGDTAAFSEAACLGDVELLRCLLNRGLNPNLRKPAKADLPLAAALFGGCAEAVRILLSAGADPNLPNRGNMRPLEIAIRSGRIEPVQLLLHQGADPDRPSAKGFTPLMIATQLGHGELVSLLLRRGAAVNAQDPRGRTALDIALGLTAAKPGRDNAVAHGPQDWEEADRAIRFPDIAAQLRAAGGKTGDPLAASALKGAHRGRRPEAPPRLGLTDFLEFARYTQPEFGVVAIQAPVGKTAAALAGIRSAQRWLADVPREEAAGPRRAAPSVLALVGIKRNRWTIIYRCLFGVSAHDCRLAAEDAMRLSAGLKTAAVALVRGPESDSMEYLLYQNGRVREHARWTAEQPIRAWESKLRRLVVTDIPGEDFANRLFAREGIYIPACFPRRRARGAILCVEPASAGTVERADILVLPRSRNAKR